jgi:hypothetical protein
MGKEDRLGMGGEGSVNGRREAEERRRRWGEREEERGGSWGTLGAAKSESRGERLSECLHCLHAGKQAVNTQRQGEHVKIKPDKIAENTQIIRDQHKTANTSATNRKHHPRLLASWLRNLATTDSMTNQSPDGQPHDLSPVAPRCPKRKADRLAKEHVLRFCLLPPLRPSRTPRGLRPPPAFMRLS